MKPTYGLISSEGVFPLSWSLDHVGFFTRTVEDSSIILNVLSGMGEPYSEGALIDNKPRFGLLRGFFKENAHSEVWRGFEEAVDELRAAGAEVVETALPDSFDFVHAAHRIISNSEAASFHEEYFKCGISDYRVNMRGLIASGLLIPASAYIRAKRIRGIFLGDIEATLEDLDFLLMPSATTPALRGLKSTGDHAFNSPWSFYGFPSITVPSGLTCEGLPIGIQLIGYPFEEERLLAHAGWCERVMRFQEWPPDPK